VEDLKAFSKCVSGAAVDHDLNLAKVKDCYSQAFGNELGQGIDQSRSIEDGSFLPTIGKLSSTYKKKKHIYLFLH
jgi:hypothetical protein